MTWRLPCFTALAAFAISGSEAAPLTPAQVTKLCGEAEGPAHCGRLVEAEQLKRLPGLAVREGNSLRVALFPAGNVTFCLLYTSPSPRDS